MLSFTGILQVVEKQQFKIILLNSLELLKIKSAQIGIPIKVFSIALEEVLPLIFILNSAT